MSYLSQCSHTMSPLNRPANSAWKVITHRFFLVWEYRINCNYVSLQNFSIQEIKLLSSLELHETKRAICKEILASFESYKRENPSCPVLISLLLAKHSLSPSVVSDGKDKIGYFRDNDLFEIQTTLHSYRRTFERTGDKWSLFHPTKRLGGEPQP